MNARSSSLKRSAAGSQATDNEIRKVIQLKSRLRINSTSDIIPPSNKCSKNSTSGNMFHVSRLQAMFKYFRPINAIPKFVFHPYI
jgi:hypothetical protein